MPKHLVSKEELDELEEFMAREKNSPQKALRAKMVPVCPDCFASDFEEIVEGVFMGEGIAVPTTEKRCKKCGFEGMPMEMPADKYAQALSQMRKK